MIGRRKRGGSVKVKELVEKLLKTDQEADVYIDFVQGCIFIDDEGEFTALEMEEGE